MADTALSSLTAIVTGNITGSELLYTDSGAADLKITLAQMRDWLHTQNLDAFEFVCDGGTQVLTAKVYGYIEVPYNCDLKRWTLLADVAGAVVVEVWRCTYTAFDAGGTHPVVGDKLHGTGTPPTITATNTKGQGTDFTNWTDITLDAGDVLAFAVTGSPATIKKVTCSLQVQRR